MLAARIYVMFVRLLDTRNVNICQKEVEQQKENKNATTTLIKLAIFMN